MLARRDEQHEAGEAEAHPGDVIAALVHPALEEGHEADAVGIVLDRVGLLELLGEHPHLGLGLAHRDPGSQAADRIQPVVAPVVALLVGEGQGPPRVHPAPHEGVVGAGRHDADDGRGLAVHAHRAAHHRRIRGVASRPEPVAQHHDVALARAVFLGVKTRPRAGGMPRSGKEVARGHDAVHAVGRLAGLGQVEGRTRRTRPSSRRPRSSPGSRAGWARSAASSATAATSGRPAPAGSARDRAGRRGCVASMTLNIDVFTPMPRARVRTATAVKPGVLPRRRSPYRTSRQSRSIAWRTPSGFVDASHLPRGHPDKSHAVKGTARRAARGVFGPGTSPSHLRTAGGSREHRRQQPFQTVVALSGTALDAGLHDRVADLLRGVEHGGREGGRAIVLDQGRGHEGLARVPVEPRLGVGETLARHDLAIDPLRAHVLPAGAAPHEAVGTAHGEGRSRRSRATGRALPTSA